MKYPYSPGYKEETTSKEAARRIAKKADAIKERVYKILLTGSFTANEIQKLMPDETVTSIRSRLSELEAEKDEKTGQFKPRAKKTTDTRINENGYRVRVWKAVKQETAKQIDLLKAA